MKLSKNIVSNISTDYNKIKPKNVSKPNNHKKQKKDLSVSGGAELAISNTGDNSNTGGLSLTTSGITFSGGGELDSGMTYGVNFELENIASPSKEIVREFVKIIN